MAKLPKKVSKKQEAEFKAEHEAQKKVGKVMFFLIYGVIMTFASLAIPAYFFILVDDPDMGQKALGVVGLLSAINHLTLALYKVYITIK